ncbi:MAG: hypothetical protein HQM14_11205 [SAR324 cluster bacterium]|nr:hypothetical protein [SAR324 cluster bacterium]
MQAITSIAKTTVQAWVRDKTFYSILIISVFVVLCSLFLKEMTLGNRSQVVHDLGLATILFFGVFMSLFTTTVSVKDKTLYMILTKPIPRFYWIVGNYAGHVFIVLVNTLVLAGVLYGLSEVLGIPWFSGLNYAIYLIFLELMIIVAVSLFFSSFMTSAALSKFCTLCVVVAGHILEETKNLLSAGAGEVFKPVLTALYYLLPNFKAFDVKTEAVHQLPIESSHLEFASVYGLVYVAILIILSSWIFARTEL